MVKISKVFRFLPVHEISGLTAFLLAWTQDESHFFSGEHARFVATAAHSITQLLDVYTTLEPGSFYRKEIIALLIANIIWLIGEIKSYRDNLPHEWHSSPITIAYDGECPICYEKNTDFEQGKNDFRKLQCGHIFCKNCLMQYINTQLKDNNFANLHCPRTGCRHLIDETEIRKIVDDDITVLSNYDDVAFKDWKIKAQQFGWRQCPTPDCGYGFLNDENHQRIIQCPSCHQYYCGNCLINHSYGTPCQVNAVSAGGDANVRWLNQHAKACPGCRRMIEKNNGCNHMTCRCGHQFCWICLRAWGHQGCFNH